MQTIVNVSDRGRNDASKESKERYKGKKKSAWLSRFDAACVAVDVGP